MSVFPAVSTGIPQSILTALVPNRRAIGTIGTIGAIVADTVVEEQHQDRSQLTDHPVEEGSVVTDNKVDMPAEVILTYGWVTGSSQNAAQSETFLRNVYNQLLQLKKSGIRFSVYTGKRVYTNMLIETISTTTSEKTENALIVRVQVREVIVVQTRTFTIPQDPTQVRDPQSSAPIVNKGTQQVVAKSVTPTNPDVATPTTTPAPSPSSVQKKRDSASGGMWNAVWGMLGVETRTAQ